MNITNREKVLLLFLIGFLIIGAGWALLVNPQIEKYSDNKKNYEDAKQLEQEAIIANKAFEEISKNIDSIYENAKKEGEVFYNSLSEGELEIVVTDVLKKYNINYQSTRIIGCQTVQIQGYNMPTDKTLATSKDTVAKTNTSVKTTQTTTNAKDTAKGTDTPQPNTIIKGTVEVGFIALESDILGACEEISKGPMKMHVSSCTYKNNGQAVEGLMTIDVYCDNKI